MFGWIEHSPIGENEVPKYGVRLERYDTGTWLTLWWGKRKRMWRKIRELRDSGPEDNRAVLGWFFRGPELRPRGRKFRSGFAEAAAKGPVKWPTANREGCPGCDDPEC